MRVGSDRSVNGVSSRGNDLDLRLLGLALWRKKSRVLIPAAVVAGLAIVAVNIVTPRYESEARLLIEGRENVFLRPGNDRNATEDTRAAIDAEAITSQAQVLQSRDIALQVIKELKLGERPEFDPVRGGPSLVGTILSLFGLGKDTMRLTPEERVMTNYFQRLSVIPIEKSRVIQIKFQSSDPELSARAVNAIIDTYFVFQRTSKIEQNRNASVWLEQEIEKLRPKVAEAERNVENFRAKANLFVGTNNAGLTNQQLADVTTQLAAARSQKADLDARARMIRNMLRSGRPIESSDITNSELIRRLVEQRVTLRAQLAEQSSTLMDQHPRIKELRAQISALDAQIRAETVTLVESIENDARIAAARIETTMAAADQLKNQIAGLSTQDVQLRALEREAKAQRDLLESYLGKYREATTRDSLGAAPSDVRVISRAIASNSPAFPKKLSMVALATLATLFIGATFVVTGELLDPSGQRPAPGPRKTPMRVFGLFGRKGRKGAKGAPAGDVADLKVPPTAAAKSAGLSVDTLAAALRRAGDAGRRVAVIGTARNAGTTTAALALARALARQGARVVLVDMAFSTPNLSVASSDPGAPGIADVARGSASFGSIVTRDRFSPVHVIATGHLGGDHAAILASPRLAMTFDALMHSYDHVLLDSGCVADATVGMLTRFAPRAVLVVGEADTADAARERLLGAGFIEVTVIPGRTDTDRPAAA